MAALISWLREYHAGKTGVIPFQSPDPYGGKLGFYCKQHPVAKFDRRIGANSHGFGSRYLMPNHLHLASRRVADQRQSRDPRHSRVPRSTVHSIAQCCAKTDRAASDFK
jgi:hypothetical protein